MDNFSAGTNFLDLEKENVPAGYPASHYMLFRLAIATCRPPILTVPKNWSASHRNRWTTSIGITGRLESDSNLFTAFMIAHDLSVSIFWLVNRPPESSRALRIPVRKNVPGLQVPCQPRPLRTSTPLGLRSSPHRVSYQQPFADRAAGRYHS